MPELTNGLTPRSLIALALMLPLITSVQLNLAGKFTINAPSTN